MGAYNFVGRISTAAAPMIAELGDIVPMACIVTMTVMAGLASSCLKK